MGRDITQTIGNKTIDGTDATGNNTISIDATDAAYDNTSSGLSATNSQTAIDEVEGRLYTEESASTTHIADTTTHGTTGNIVGESDTQNLSNKTFTDVTNCTDTTQSTTKDD